MSNLPISELVHELPVFPPVSAEVVRAAKDGTISAEQLIQLASYDTVLAGRLIQAANAGSLSWVQHGHPIEQAVLYLGEVRSTQVLLAACQKELSAVPGHQRLWEHCHDIAHIAHQIASKTNMINCGDAYVIGLVHDVGALLFKIGPPESLARLQQMLSDGCERDVAEQTVYGTTHGEAGAEVLRRWRMPEEYIDAVQHHHQPETGGGAGAAVLYLAEQWFAAHVGPMAKTRLHRSLKTLQLEMIDDLIRTIRRTASSRLRS